MKRKIYGLFSALLLLAVIAVLWAFSVSPVYNGPVSDHFDGEYFYNESKDYRHKSISDLIQWALNRERKDDWNWVDLPHGTSIPDEKIVSPIQVTFVNHATVLLQFSNLNILTDPIWAERASPVSWFGPKRYHRPGVDFDDLPPIDYVLISHNHFDHMDLPTLRRLWQKSQPTFIVGLGNSQLLTSLGITKTVELDWWQPYVINEDVTIHGVPAQHWSTRNRIDAFRMLWMGYVIDSSHGPVYFAGDTGFGPHFQSIMQRFGPMHLSLLPIGAYLPRWFMKYNHLSPDDALKAHQILQSEKSMAIHFGTYPLADDEQFETPAIFKKLREDKGITASEFWLPDPGGRYVLEKSTVSLHGVYY